MESCTTIRTGRHDETTSVLMLGIDNPMLDCDGSACFNLYYPDILHSPTLLNLREKEHGDPPQRNNGASLSLAV